MKSLYRDKFSHVPKICDTAYGILSVFPAEWHQFMCRRMCIYCNWTTLLIAGFEVTTDSIDGYVNKVKCKNKYFVCVVL